MEDGGLVEACQLGHVLHLVELGRVHLLKVVLGDVAALARLHDLHLDLVEALALDGRRDEPEVLVRHPDQPLLRPFGLRRRVVEGVPVDDQVFEIGIVAIQPRVVVRHFCSDRSKGRGKRLSRRRRLSTWW